MIKRDYHGFKTDAALADLETIISSIRQRRETEDAELITGHGIIAERVLNVLRYTYGLQPSVKLGNSGVILCTIE